MLVKAIAVTEQFYILTYFWKWNTLWNSFINFLKINYPTMDLENSKKLADDAIFPCKIVR